MARLEWKDINIPFPNVSPSANQKSAAEQQVAGLSSAFEAFGKTSDTYAKGIQEKAAAALYQQILGAENNDQARQAIQGVNPSNLSTEHYDKLDALMTSGVNRNAKQHDLTKSEYAFDRLQLVDDYLDNNPQLRARLLALGGKGDTRGQANLLSQAISSMEGVPHEIRAAMADDLEFGVKNKSLNISQGNLALQQRKFDASQQEKADIKAEKDHKLQAERFVNSLVDLPPAAQRGAVNAAVDSGEPWTKYLNRIGLPEPELSDTPTAMIAVDNAGRPIKTTAGDLKSDGKKDKTPSIIDPNSGKINARFSVDTGNDEIDAMNTQLNDVLDKLNERSGATELVLGNLDAGASMIKVVDEMAKNVEGLDKNWFQEQIKDVQERLPKNHSTPKQIAEALHQNMQRNTGIPIIRDIGAAVMGQMGMDTGKTYFEIDTDLVGKQLLNRSTGVTSTIVQERLEAVKALGEYEKQGAIVQKAQDKLTQILNELKQTPNDIRLRQAERYWRGQREVALEDLHNTYQKVLSYGDVGSTVASF